MKLQLLSRAELDQLVARVRSEPFGTHHLEARLLATLEHRERMLALWERGSSDDAWMLKRDTEIVL